MRYSTSHIHVVVRKTDLSQILENIELYEDLPVDYLQDVISQLQNVSERGMIKVGKRTQEHEYEKAA